MICKEDLCISIYTFIVHMAVFTYALKMLDDLKSLVRNAIEVHHQLMLHLLHC
jgi:hypothetical protein